MNQRQTVVAATALLVVAAVVAALSQAAPQNQLEAVLRGTEVPPNAIWLDSLDLSRMVQRRETPRPRATLARAPRGRGAGAAGAPAAAGGRGTAPAPLPIKLAGVEYHHGIGTLSINELIIDLKGQATRFVAMVGLDDSAPSQGSVTVEVWVDNKKTLITPVLKTGGAPVLVDADLTGARFLELTIDDGGDVSTGDYADWGGGLIYLKPGATEKPETWTFPSEAPTPIASGWPAQPRVNAPRITGGTPGRPFLFKIPATGEAPLTFAARNLPAGLALDAATGIITGAIAREGRTAVEVTVTNARGRTTNTLTIVGGTDALALTPPLGWNSWNVWGRSVDEAKVRAAADAMISSGLAAHGYQFVNIDDGWEGVRDANGVLQPNEKFPNMKALTDSVHAKGLKIGIYSSPGARTCQGLPGSLGYEEIDARTWAEWGFDVLKHDWCSYGSTDPNQPLADLQKPYIVMRDALMKTGRDIIYSLCQYGMGKVWEWGADVGGHYWRTTGDLTDVWSNMAAVGFRQSENVKWSRPGHWTDPDMLVIGKVGWGPNIHDTRLTPNEQITHISLWTIQAAPLLIGADMAQFDKFTTDLMTNHEVLEVNQDVLGKAGQRVWQQDRLEVWARPLADGTRAVALFNRGLQAATVTARWSDIGATGRQTVRDLWRHRDLGQFTDAFSTTVPAHGAMLVKVGGQARPDVASFEGLLVGPPPAELKLDPFYEKYADAYGIPVIAGKVVEGTALLVARDIVNYMLLKRPDVRTEMVRQNYRVGIIGRDQGQTDLPEYRNYKKPAIDDRRLTPRERQQYNEPGGIASMTDAEYWNRRARGLGGRYTTSGEENLLGIPRSRYYGEHILVHEFSHGIMSALRTVDPAFHAEIQKAYDAAKTKGLFRGHYAENTAAEYWAEGTQWWFWSNYGWNAPTGERLWTPDSLKAYDPVLFELLSRVYASHHIPADIYHAREVRR